MAGCCIEYICQTHTDGSIHLSPTGSYYQETEFNCTGSGQDYCYHHCYDGNGNCTGPMWVSKPLYYSADPCPTSTSTSTSTTPQACDCCLGWCLNEDTPDCFICSTDCNDYNTVARFATQELCELDRPSYNANCYAELFQNPDCWECRFSANGAYTGPDKNALCLADAEMLNQYIPGCSDYCYLIKYCGSAPATTATSTTYSGGCCIESFCNTSGAIQLTGNEYNCSTGTVTGYCHNACGLDMTCNGSITYYFFPYAPCATTPNPNPTPTPTPTPTTCPECYKCSQNAGEGETIVDTFRGPNACESCASVLESYNVNCSTTTTTTHNPCASPPCCPDETGTACGANCCCCGSGLAPIGPNCECLPCGSSREECEGTTTTSTSTTSTSTSTSTTGTSTSTTSCPCAGVIATNLICQNGIQQYLTFSCASPCLASGRAGWPNAGGPCITPQDFLFTTYQCSCTTSTTTTETPTTTTGTPTTTTETPTTTTETPTTTTSTPTTTTETPTTTTSTPTTTTSTPTTTTETPTTTTGTPTFTSSP